MDNRTETVLEMTHRHLEVTTEAVKQLHEMVRTSSNDQEKKTLNDLLIKIVS